MVDGGILSRLELRDRQLAALHALSSFEQLGRAQEAADDVRARLDHGRNLRPWPEQRRRTLPVRFALRRAGTDLMKDILVVCPQERDIRNIEAAKLEQRFRVRYVGSDLDQLETFDPEAFLAECAEVPADGIVATKDQSALLAALLAERRGLAGPSSAALVACQHKPISRAIQERAAPESTPRFAILDGRLPFPLPVFVKPVVGRLSQNAYRIDEPDDLLQLHEADRYTNRYAEIAALAGAPRESAHGFLVEELLTGAEVTLEGYVHNGPGRHDRYHRLGQVPGHALVRALRVSEHPFAGAPVRAVRHRRARAAGARVRHGASSTWSSSCRSRGPRRSSR